MAQKSDERIVMKNNILFVCSANKDRSATAEHYYAEKYPSLNFDSVGTNQKICFQLGTTFVSQESINWADYIFFMEQKHQQFIHTHFKLKQATIIRVLSIKDVYSFMDSDLIVELELALNSFFKTLK